jgi:TolB-like protein
LTHQRQERIFWFAGFGLDQERAVLRRGQQVIPLRRKAFEVLTHLVENHDRLIAKDEFMRVIWPNVFVTEDSLVQCVHDIRRALDDRSQQLIKAVPRRGYVFSAPVHVASFALPAHGSIDRVPCLSIAVMPFVDLGGDRDQDFFADGLTDDLTTDLSRLGDSFVIARNTAFTYKEKATDARDIGRDLGVRYLLEGGVQRSGKRLRVNVRLVDTDTAGAVWAERFDGDRADLFETQDQITGRIVRALELELPSAEWRRSERERPGEPDAMDLAMRGWSLVYRRTSPETYAAASAFFDRALALDAQTSSALVGIAWTAAHACVAWPSASRDADSSIALEHVERAAALAPYDARVHQIRGFLHRFRKDTATAAEAYDAALAANRNYANAYAQLGVAMTELGQPERTWSYIERALRLSPRDPSLGIWLGLAASAELMMERYDDAIALYERARNLGLILSRHLVGLGAAHALRGDQAAACKTVTALLEKFPGITLDKVREETWTANPRYIDSREQCYAALRAVGMPA